MVLVRRDRPSGRRTVVTAMVAALLAVPLLAGCSSGDDASGASVMDVKVGQCFLAPGRIEDQIKDVERVDCAKPHAQEAYATPTYDAADGSGDAFPGDDALDRFAEGSCAEKFGAYVGVDYLDSSLFFTYLAPSARSWQQDDRTVLCFVTTTGAPLVGSVKGKAL
jgi:hypothetical protein